MERESVSCPWSSRKSMTAALIVCSSSGRVVQILGSSGQEQLSALQPGTRAHSTFSVVITRHIVTVTVGQIDFGTEATASCKFFFLAAVPPKE